MKDTGFRAKCMDLATTRPVQGERDLSFVMATKSKQFRNS